MATRPDIALRTTSRLKPRFRVGDERSSATERARRKFLRFFPAGFRDETYLDWERNYKWEAHERWCRVLRRSSFRSLIDDRDYATVAREAVTVESRTNLLFSFEKMALRDAVKEGGARVFAEGLYGLLYGSGTDQERFERWVAVVDSLPRRQTRVLTWPMVTE